MKQNVNYKTQSTLTVYYFTLRTSNGFFLLAINISSAGIWKYLAGIFQRFSPSSLVKGLNFLMSVEESKLCIMSFTHSQNTVHLTRLVTCKSRFETAVKYASTHTSFSSNLMFKRSLGCRCYQVLNLDLDIRFPQLPLFPIIVDKLTIQNL